MLVLPEFLRKLEKAVAVSGICSGVPEEIPGKSRENCWNMFPESRNALYSRFRAPGKANLPGTLGPHCRDLVPTFRAGCFLKSTVPAFSSFSEFQEPEGRFVRLDDPPVVRGIFGPKISSLGCVLVLSVAIPAEPRGEKLFYFCKIWAVKNS